MPQRHDTIALLLLLSFTLPLAAQDAAAGGQAPAMRQRADAAFSSSDWAAAANLYSRLTELIPEDATAWFRVGLTTLQAEGEPAAAITAYEKAIGLGYAQAPALFGIARAHAIAQNKSAALEQLEGLADLGASRGIAQRLESSKEFAQFQGDPRFQGALDRLTPCNSAEYRKFDFWLGTWEVQSPSGQVVGQNIVSELTDRCILFEDWTGTSGHKGLSINYFDPNDGTWNQIFRDNTGNIAAWPDLKGGFRDGSMVLESPPEGESRTRWIWTRVTDDKVRQMAESSRDGGATWTVVWDSYYVRRGEASNP